MNREIFFRKKVEFLTIDQVLKITGSKLIAELDLLADLSIKIYDIATLEKADETKISFLSLQLLFIPFLLIKGEYAFPEPRA